MKKYYDSEIQGMVDFWRELGLEPDYDLNTDGRYQGNLVEFKKVFQEPYKQREQLKRYIKAFNSAAIPIPKWSYLISLNTREFIKINNETEDEVSRGNWKNPEDFKEEFINQKESIKGWIDEFSIVSYNNLLCQTHPKIFKSKEEVKNEFVEPKFLKIKPFDWDSIIKEEQNLIDGVGWLHFNMNMLGPALLKKQLGAFFTPDEYIKKSTEMLRDAINKISEGNDYIILDRCAGTGNLQRYLTEEELSHCVLNTYDYTEWTTLKGLYEGRVRMIIPPTRTRLDFNNGLLTDGDALSEEFYNFCFNKGIIGINDELFEEQSKRLASWLKDDKTNIIMIENPPFVEPQGGASQGKQTFTIKDKFMYKVMGKYDFKTKNVNRATENLFIWSAFQFYLKKPNDAYILFSPIKYWKSQQIIDKKFIKGYICNREKFNATEGGVLLIHWENMDDTNETLVVNSDLGERVVKKMHNYPLQLMKDSESGYSLFNQINERPIGWLVNVSNIPKTDNGKLFNNVEDYSPYLKVQKAYKLGEDNILSQIPLWLANNYDYAEYTEKEVIMKTSDGGVKYTSDALFLNKSLLWAALSNRNKCMSKEEYKNEFCLSQNTRVDRLIKSNLFDKVDLKLIKAWNDILEYSRHLDEYNSNYNYGLDQLEREVNIKIESGSFNKRGQPLMIPKYDMLDILISKFKVGLKRYYNNELKPKLFDYELLK